MVEKIYQRLVIILVLAVALVNYLFLLYSAISQMENMQRISLLGLFAELICLDFQKYRPLQ